MKLAPLLSLPFLFVGEARAAAPLSNDNVATMWGVSGAESSAVVVTGLVGLIALADGKSAGNVGLAYFNVPLVGVGLYFGAQKEHWRPAGAAALHGGQWGMFAGAMAGAHLDGLARGETFAFGWWTVGLGLAASATGAIVGATKVDTLPKANVFYLAPYAGFATGLFAWAVTTPWRNGGRDADRAKRGWTAALIGYAAPVVASWLFAVIAAGPSEKTAFTSAPLDVAFSW